MDIEKLFEDEFRNHLHTTDENGKRLWVYARIVKGYFYKLRSYFAWFLLALLFGLPFLKINGNQSFLFNIIERRFIFFGVEFFPQDFHLVALGLLITLLFIALFTALFGRVWCGWACPQTIFLEFVFRKVENLVEGDYRAQKRLDDQPWNAEKIRKKTLKHAIYLIISFLIANIFLAYIIGVDSLKEIILDNPLNHLGGLASIVLFTLVFYYVFAKFRENVCTMVCPYGRLQSSLIDQRSLIVGYDVVRGEPRGRISKKDENPEPKGDCIDCKICVQVCPTGIDIRDGLQMECVACTACIDACDDVMTKINKPTGLIKYTSLENLEGKETKKLNTRNIAYAAMLTVLLGLFIALLANRTSIETTILRTPGLTYQESGNNAVTNLYNYSILNKTQEDFNVSFKVNNIEGATLKWVGSSPTVPAGEMAEGTFILNVPKDQIKTTSTKFEIEVINDKDEVLDTVHTSFMGPTN